MNKSKFFLFSSAGLIVVWWLLSAPPDNFTIAESYHLGGGSEEILAVESKVDIIAEGLSNDKFEMQGYDDIAFNLQTNSAYLSGMGGAIWKVEGNSLKEICVEYNWDGVLSLVEPFLDDYLYDALVMQGISIEYRTSEAAIQVRGDIKDKVILEILDKIIEADCID